MDVYLIPGLGTDHRLFSRLALADFHTRVLEWPRYEAREGLADIAVRMAQEIDASRPHILVGVSMGGMVAQELALLTRPRHVVLVSSVTGPHEFPQLLRWCHRLQLHRTINDLSIRLTWPLRRRFGVQDPAIARLLCDMAYDQGGRQIRRGTDAIVRWRGSRWEGPLTRLHGDADRVLPLRATVDHVIPGGTHPMVIVRAAEVEQLLGDVLRRVMHAEAEVARQAN